MMSLGNLLGLGIVSRQKDPNFTTEIQAYRWLVWIFWRNLAIFSQKKKN
jgi:hypothetical protein